MWSHVHHVTTLRHVVTCLRVDILWSVSCSRKIAVRTRRNAITVMCAWNRRIEQKNRTHRNPGSGKFSMTSLRNGSHLIPIPLSEHTAFPPVCWHNITRLQVCKCLSTRFFDIFYAVGYMQELLCARVSTHWTINASGYIGLNILGSGMLFATFHRLR